MLAANTFDVLNANGTPTLAGMTVTGRSATLFVMVAGISLAFLTGGRHPVQGRARRAARAGIAVRALLITAIGLALGYFAGDLSVILAYYGVFFLLAIPLIGLRPRSLACIAGVLVVVGPLILLASYKLGMNAAFPGGTGQPDGSPTLGAPFTHPIGFVLQLLVTGDYPAVVYMAYICVGLAIGRLDLSSTKVAARLLAGGLVMAVTAWFTSSAILFHLGGLQHLHAAADPSTPASQVTNTIVWDPGNRVASWWWLAIRAHHTGTPIDMLHTLGCAMAVLGAVLLVTKLRVARRLLWPVGVAGTMTLTIYSAHALVLNANWAPLSGNDYIAYAEQVAVALAFAVVWHRFRGQGPLERVVSAASGRARRAVMARPAQGRSEPRRGAEPSELKDDHTAETATTLTAAGSPARTAEPGERSHELVSTMPMVAATRVWRSRLTHRGDQVGPADQPGLPGGGKLGDVIAVRASAAVRARFACEPAAVAAVSAPRRLADLVQRAGRWRAGGRRVWH